VGCIFIGIKKAYGVSRLLNRLFGEIAFSPFHTILVLTLFVCFWGIGRAAFASEVVAVIEGRQWPYEKALSGIVETCKCSVDTFYLDEIEQVSTFKKKLAFEQPRILVAVGTKSLEFIISNDFGLPVVYSMVLNPWSKIPSRSADVTGVSMNVSPDLYWDVLAHIRPAIRTVGLVYNPVETQKLKDYAEKLAVEHGQKLIAVPAHNPKEALHAIEGMASRIDAFWMLPDQSLVRQEIIDSLVSYSFEQHFVLIGLSSKHVSAGALMAYSFNSKSIGESSGRMVDATLKSTMPKDGNSIWAPKTDLAINLKTANRIKVVIDPVILKRAKSVVE
jgi:ABC-type uncharacterized transport system substrate-binding protein